MEHSNSTSQNMSYQQQTTRYNRSVSREMARDHTLNEMSYCYEQINKKLRIINQTFQEEMFQPYFTINQEEIFEIIRDTVKNFPFRALIIDCIVIISKSKHHKLVVGKKLNAWLLKELDNDNDDNILKILKILGQLSLQRDWCIQIIIDDGLQNKICELIYLKESQTTIFIEAILILQYLFKYKQIQATLQALFYAFQRIDKKDTVIALLLILENARAIYFLTKQLDNKDYEMRHKVISGFQMISQCDNETIQLLIDTTFQKLILNIEFDNVQLVIQIGVIIDNVLDKISIQGAITILKMKIYNKLVESLKQSQNKMFAITLFEGLLILLRKVFQHFDQIGSNKFYEFLEDYDFPQILFQCKRDLTNEIIKYIDLILEEFFQTSNYEYKQHQIQSLNHFGSHLCNQQIFEF
eukprot:403376830